MTGNLPSYFVLVFLAALVAGCSAESQRLTAEKREIDMQRDAQMKMIDNRTTELKREIDIKRFRADSIIEDRKRQPNADRAQLDSQKKEIMQQSEQAKKDLDKQAAACKKQVDQNAETVKAQIEGNASRYQ